MRILLTLVGLIFLASTAFGAGGEETCKVDGRQFEGCFVSTAPGASTGFCPRPSGEPLS
jgi:hypothetical protein